MDRKKLIDGLLILLILGSLLTKNAKAYLDPGANSYLLQILLATLFSTLLVVKNFWRKITSFIKNVYQKVMNKNQS